MTNLVNYDNTTSPGATWAMDTVKSLNDSKGMWKSVLLSRVAAELSSIPVAIDAVIHLASVVTKTTIAVIVRVFELGLGIFGSKVDIGDKLGLSHYTAHEAANHAAKCLGDIGLAAMLLVGGWTSPSGLVAISRSLGLSKTPVETPQLTFMGHVAEKAGYVGAAAIRNPGKTVLILGATAGAIYSGIPQAVVGGTVNAGWSATTAVTSGLGSIAESVRCALPWPLSAGCDAGDTSPLSGEEKPKENGPGIQEPKSEGSTESPTPTPTKTPSATKVKSPEVSNSASISNTPSPSPSPSTSKTVTSSTTISNSDTKTATKTTSPSSSTKDADKPSENPFSWANIDRSILDGAGEKFMNQAWSYLGYGNKEEV